MHRSDVSVHEEQSSKSCEVQESDGGAADRYSAWIYDYLDPPPKDPILPVGQALQFRFSTSLSLTHITTSRKMTTPMPAETGQEMTYWKHGWEKCKQQPMVPIGAAATTVALLGATASLRSGNRASFQKYLRLRVA